MLNKLFMAVGQITIGAIVGSMAGEVFNSALIKPIKKKLSKSEKES